MHLCTGHPKLQPRTLFTSWTHSFSLLCDVTRNNLWYRGCWRFFLPFSGNQLQNLKFDFPQDAFQRKLKLFGYVFVHILVPYIFNRLSLKSQKWVSLPATDPKKKLWLLLTKVESIWKYLTFLHFIYFLLSGKYVSVPNHLLGLRLVYASTGARSVSFDFMNRQLIWNGFSEFMFFIMPMVNVSRVKEFFRNFFQFHKWTGAEQQDSDVLDKISCGICEESPITMSYCDADGGCKHNYCYYCLQQKLIENGHYVCPVDKAKIVTITRSK